MKASNIGRFVLSNWTLLLAAFVLICLVIPVTYFSLIFRVAGLQAVIASPPLSGLPDVQHRSEQNESFSVGVSLNSLVEARWLQEWELFRRRGADLGLAVTVKFAENDVKRQEAQIRTMLAEGVRVLIVVPGGTSLRPVLKEAADAGVKIVAYDTLIPGPADCYVGFDYRAWGRLQAAALTSLLPAGNLAVLTGPRGDYRAEEILKGYHDVLRGETHDGSASTTGEERETGSQIRWETPATEFLPKWSGIEAVSYLRNIMTRQRVDGILAPTDAVASEIVLFLKEHRLPALLTGGGAEIAGSKRVLSGEQVMTVFSDYRLSVEVALKLARRLAAGQPLTAIPLPAFASADALGQSRGLNGQSVSFPLGEIEFAGRKIPAVVLPVRPLNRQNIVRVLVDEEHFYNKTFFTGL